MRLLKKFLPLLLFSALLSHATATAQNRPQKTIINDANAKQMLLGVHRFALQWISWDYFGKAVVTEKNGVLFIKGEQKRRGGGGDYVNIDGVITEVSAKEFKFVGTVDLRVSHNAEGNHCPHQGELTFKITGTRKYWRIQEMDNPCDSVTDYVDFFFK
jgi:hypothetical protein